MENLFIFVTNFSINFGAHKYFLHVFGNGKQNIFCIFGGKLNFHGNGVVCMHSKMVRENYRENYLLRNHFEEN